MIPPPFGAARPALHVAAMAKTYGASTLSNLSVKCRRCCMSRIAQGDSHMSISLSERSGPLSLGACGALLA